MRVVANLTAIGLRVFVGVLLATPLLGYAVDCSCGSNNSCGCQQSCCKVPCRHCFFKHHHGCCCQSCQQPTPKQATLETAPKAAVVESLPMFNATPGIFSMPMMMPMAIQQANFQTPKAAETCSSSGGRVADIEERVNALDVRMRTIQRAVEIQTVILESLKAEGKFPTRFQNQAGTTSGSDTN